MGEGTAAAADGKANVTLLREGFDALARGDLDAFLSLYADDVTWYGTGLDGAPTIMDKATMLANTAELTRDLAESATEPVDFRAVGPDLVVCTVRARRRASWQQTTTEGIFLTFYRFENGRITLGGDVASKVLEDFWVSYRAERDAGAGR